MVVDPVKVLGAQSVRRSLPASVSGSSPASVTRPATGVHHLPVVMCPACGATEPGAYVGNRSHEVVVMNRDWFRDSSGYYYCRECFACWPTLHVLGESPSMAATERTTATWPGASNRVMEPYAALGIRTPWADASGRWRYLATVQREVDQKAIVASTGSHSARRAADRMRDAEIVGEQLELPRDLREAISFHIVALAERVPRLQRLAMARSEAFTLATVDLVCERFHAPVTNLPEVLRYADGTTVEPKEFARARDALGAWFREHLWRNDSNRRE